MLGEGLSIFIFFMYPSHMYVGVLTSQAPWTPGSASFINGESWAHRAVCVWVVWAGDKTEIPFSRPLSHVPVSFPITTVL